MPVISNEEVKTEGSPDQGQPGLKSQTVSQNQIDKHRTTEENEKKHRIFSNTDCMHVLQFRNYTAYQSVIELSLNICGYLGIIFPRNKP